jgi:Rps23 Pro-64 3,4-dihydroxylase Tpa1-like proline 4-hydroxylase
MSIGGAMDQLTQLPLPKHYGLALDDIYNQRREISDILTLNRKAFDKSLLDTLSQLSPLILDIRDVNEDSTKIKYYENGEYYKSHRDNPRFTMLTYLYKEPKAFTGGDLYFEDFNYTIPIENNMLVFFTGCIRHASTGIKMTDHINKKCSGYGKYTITQFSGLKG